MELLKKKERIEPEPDLSHVIKSQMFQRISIIGIVLLRIAIFISHNYNFHAGAL
jgi:hypothetical protein